MVAWTVVALLSPVVRAEPSAAEKETARSLLFDGRAKFAAKDYQSAVKSFEAAHAIMNVPTTGLDLARGLEALGRLLDARATALEVARIPVRNGEPPIFGKARKQAEDLAAALAARIPSVVISVKGAEGAAVTVTLDGTPLPEEMLGLPRKVDPGAHVVAASAPGLVGRPQQVEVREGATATVVVPMSVPAADAAPVKQGAPAWVWVVGGAGIAALGASVGFAVDLMEVRSGCPDAWCDLAPHEVDSLNLRWKVDLGLSIGLGTMGAVGMIAAVVGVMRRSPAERRVTRAGFVPWMAPGIAGGAFVGVF